MTNKAPEICDYKDTDYHKDFWQGSVDRTYEDLVERDLIRALLPKAGYSFIDVGAGFGRLTPEYFDRFNRVILLDYAQHLLAEARQKFISRQNIEYIQASCYEIPLPDNVIEMGLSMRLMHHIEDVDKFFSELNRILQPGGKFILEFANKRNALEIVRLFLGKSKKSPFSQNPYRYGEAVFYNFHPKYIKDRVKSNGFGIKKVYSLSNFRYPILKKIFGNSILLVAERIVRGMLGKIFFGPSIVLVLEKK